MVNWELGESLLCAQLRLVFSVTLGESLKLGAPVSIYEIRIMSPESSLPPGGGGTNEIINCEVL